MEGGGEQGAGGESGAATLGGGDEGRGMFVFVSMFGEDGGRKERACREGRRCGIWRRRQLAVLTVDSGNGLQTLE